VPQWDEGDKKETGSIIRKGDILSNSRTKVKEAELRIKWWYWFLLGLGLVMVIGGIIYAFISGMFG